LITKMLRFPAVTDFSVRHQTIRIGSGPGTHPEYSPVDIGLVSSELKGQEHEVDHSPHLQFVSRLKHAELYLHFHINLHGAVRNEQLCLQPL
jgi:hypothetical protein